MATWKWRHAWLWMLVGGVVTGQSARADVRAVRLGVKGATCATCAFALRKAFKNLKGVADARLTTKMACMEVQMKAGLWPDLPKMQRTIKEAGFEPKNADVELVVTGVLRREGERIVVDLAGMKSPQWVTLDPQGVNSDVMVQLNRPVELKGRWKPVEGDPAGGGTLSVLAVQLQK